MNSGDTYCTHQMVELARNHEDENSVGIDRKYVLEESLLLTAYKIMSDITRLRHKYGTYSAMEAIMRAENAVEPSADSVQEGAPVLPDAVRTDETQPDQDFMTANSVDDAMGNTGRTIVHQSTSVLQVSENAEMEVESPTSIAHGDDTITATAPEFPPLPEDLEEAAQPEQESDESPSKRRRNSPPDSPTDNHTGAASSGQPLSARLEQSYAAHMQGASAPSLTGVTDIIAPGNVQTQGAAQTIITPAMVQLVTDNLSGTHTSDEQEPAHSPRLRTTDILEDIHALVNEPIISFNEQDSGVKMFVWNPSAKPKHAVHTRAVEKILWSEQYDLGVLQEAGLEKGFIGWKQLISNDRMTILGHPNRVRSMTAVAERAIERRSNKRRGVSYIQAVDVTFNCETTIRVINTHIHCMVAKDFNKGPNGRMAPRRALTTVYEAMLDLMSTDKQTIFAGDFNQAGSHGVVSTHLRETLHSRDKVQRRFHDFFARNSVYQDDADMRNEVTDAISSDIMLPNTLEIGEWLPTSGMNDRGVPAWTRLLEQTEDSHLNSTLFRETLPGTELTVQRGADESLAHYNARRQCAIMLPRFHTVAEDNEHHIMLVNLGILSVHMTPAEPTPTPDPTQEFNSQRNETEEDSGEYDDSESGGDIDMDGQNEDVQMEIISDDDPEDVAAGNQAALSAVNDTMPNVGNLCPQLRPPPPPPGPPPPGAIRVDTGQSTDQSAEGASGRPVVHQSTSGARSSTDVFNNDDSMPEMRTAAAASALQGTAGDANRSTPNENVSQAMGTERQASKAMLAPGQEQTINNDRVRQAVAEQTGQIEFKGGDIVNMGQLLTLVKSGHFEDDFSYKKGMDAHGTTSERDTWHRLRERQ